MAVGLIVGGWFASTVISKLINELIEYAKDQKKKQLGLKDELARLEKALPKIQAVVNAIDQGLIREKNPALEKWLWQLRDAADQADDVMDEIKYDYEEERAVKAEKNKVDKAITNFKTFFLRAVNKDDFLKSLKKAVKAIDEVAADVVEFYKLVQHLNKNQKEVVKSAISSRETSSLLETDHIFGREKEKEDIINKLLNPVCKTKGKNFAILPITGVGGVGKTALVQLVYNDSTVKQHFELRMWVCISNNFNVQLITKKLYEAVFKKKTDFESFDFNQTELVKKLKSKRFLVVFDDVWNENDKLGWEKLVAPLKHGQSGSMILLTTRLKTVATLVRPNVMDSVILESLDEYDMWDLFEECAFGGEDPDYHKELVAIGRDIVKKLKGSPLAAKTVGGILCSDLSEVHWRSILKSELWSLQQNHNDIMPALRLTYQYLSPHLKPCFSFCSIFPKDHVFRKHDLINMWIALGMVLSDNSTIRPEDVGSKYFDDMLSKSIFIYRGDYSEEGEFVMHDLIHDLSILVSQGECLRTSTNKKESIPSTVRHLYVDSFYGLNISRLKNLRTLILNFDSYQPTDSLVTEMLKEMKNLRLLILFGGKLREIPRCVNELSHLRYLNVSSSIINADLESVSSLYLLETMVCDGFSCGQPKQGNTWGSLINLRHLSAPKVLLDNTAGIGRLTSLQELDFNVGKDDGFKICELSDMGDLRRLVIDKIENVDSCKEVEQANLKDKINLNQLILRWESPKEPNKSHLNEDVLHHLQPHHGLKELTIDNYNGTRRSIWFTTQDLKTIDNDNGTGSSIGFTTQALKTIDNYNGTGSSIWFTTQAFSKLVRLNILQCTFENLHCLEELPLLKYIDFKDMNAVKEISHCNLSSAVDAFPSLEELLINGMEELEKWDLAKKPNKWMQCLRKLHVHRCPKLQVLPPVPLCVEELEFRDLGLNALPSLWNDQSRKSGSFSDLVVMSIIDCKNIVSLDKDLLQNPDRFVILKKLDITNCGQLRNLPPGGFNKFISLKELEISKCPEIGEQECCFLPFALQRLVIDSCGHLDTTLSKALVKVHSLVELKLFDCANITSLPPKKVFSRWKTLKELTFENCPNLASLEGLLGLSFIEYMSVCKCPKLSQDHASDEATQTSDQQLLRKNLQKKQLLRKNHWRITQEKPLERSVSTQPTTTKSNHSGKTFGEIRCNPTRNFQVQSLRKNLRRDSFQPNPQLPSPITQENPLERSVSTQPTTTKSNHSGKTFGEIRFNPTRNFQVQSLRKNLWRDSFQPNPQLPSPITQEKPLLSVDEIYIDDPLLLSIEPIRSLSAVNKLIIRDCSKLQSLSELPPIRQELHINHCSPELKARCKKSGSDWSKLSQIPKVIVT